ncbi:MAG TPA: acyl carrier protein [Candidatus Aquilonibacter sp.]|nr:acyl carrier protein [Candidatus Aquilonibacter sp.]
MKAAEQPMSHVQDWLTSWFVARSKIRGEVVEISARTIRTTDYFDAGWLTSMEVVEFVTEIEQQFDMQFSENDLQDPRFVTINGLAELILARSAQMSESG